MNAVMGAVFLGEIITPTRWLGTLCIVGGTVLVGLTAPKTETQ
jgi:drug/metabolite transporter (DMT)-like permease